MADLYWFLSFVHAFFSTVVIGCSQPSNWQHCFPVHKWFVPWVHDAIHLVEDGAYYQERQALEELEGSKGSSDSNPL